MTLHLDSLILSENKTNFLLDELCQERIEAVNLINIQLKQNKCCYYITYTITGFMLSYYLSSKSERIIEYNRME
jgi:hypothetical protein